MPISRIKLNLYFTNNKKMSKTCNRIIVHYQSIKLPSHQQSIVILDNPSQILIRGSSKHPLLAINQNLVTTNAMSHFPITKLLPLPPTWTISKVFHFSFTNFFFFIFTFYIFHLTLLLLSRKREEKKIKRIAECLVTRWKTIFKGNSTIPM